MMLAVIAVVYWTLAKQTILRSNLTSKVKGMLVAIALLIQFGFSI